MAYIFFFKCRSCHEEFVLSEGTDGWIDSEGNFGRAVVDGTILGNPEGDTYQIGYDTMFCTQCGKIYYVISGNMHHIQVKKTQNIDEPKEKVYLPNISILVNKEYCPCCNVKLQQGREILKQTINREKCQKFGFEPLNSKEKALKCPYCKQDFLYYHKFWLAD
jgi:hypothetical protein